MQLFKIIYKGLKTINAPLLTKLIIAKAKLKFHCHEQ